MLQGIHTCPAGTPHSQKGFNFEKYAGDVATLNVGMCKRATQGQTDYT